MDVKASARYLPISPVKVRLVLEQIRGMNAIAATYQLEAMPQKGARLVLKLVKSALANAENNFEMDPEDLYISEIYANEGPRRNWRRFGARGRYKPIVKRTSHVTVVLSEPDYADFDEPLETETVEPVTEPLVEEDEE